MQTQDQVSIYNDSRNIELFKQFYDSSPFGVLVTDMALKKVYYQNKITSCFLEKISHYDNHENILMTFLEKHIRTLDESENFIFGKQLNNEKGSHFYCDLTVDTVSLGKRKYSIIFIKDVSEKKKAIEDLKWKEKNLKEAQKIAKVGNWVWLINEDKIEWSDQTYIIFGEEPHSFKPNLNSYMDRVFTKDRSLIQQAIRKALYYEQMFVDLEHRILLPDGSFKYVSCGASIKKDEYDKPYALLGTIQDITNRKLVEIQKDKVTHHLNQIFEHPGLGLAYLTIEGEWIKINQKFANLVGYSIGELQERRFSEMVIGEFHDLLYTIIEELKSKTITSKESELKLISKNGETRWVNSSFSTVTQPDEPTYIIVVFKCLDEKKLLQSNLQIVVDELENFVYMASHFLEGPIATILGVCQVMLLEKSFKNIQKAFSMVNETAHRMRQNLKDLLSVIDLNRTIANHSETYIKDIISDVISKVKLNYYEANNIHFITQFSINKKIKIDDTLLKVALMQILENCIKYRDLGRQNKISIAYDHQKKNIIKITDNGIGIPKNILPQVFNMFYKGNLQSNGTGLGLYIAQKAIQKIGGKIHISSKQNFGTELKIEF